MNLMSKEQEKRIRDVFLKSFERDFSSKQQSRRAAEPCIKTGSVSNNKTNICKGQNSWFIKKLPILNGGQNTCKKNELYADQTKEVHLPDISIGKHGLTSMTGRTGNAKRNKNAFSEKLPRTCQENFNHLPSKFLKFLKNPKELQKIINLDNKKLNRMQAKCVGSLLNEYTIKSINLSGNDNLGEGFYYIFNGLLPSRCNLRKIILSRMKLNDYQGYFLGFSLTNFPQIEEIDLSENNSIQACFPFILSGLKISTNFLKKLNVSYLNLNNDNGYHLGSFLKNCKIENIDLSGNKNLNQGFHKILDGLENSQESLKNASLENMNLNSSQINHWENYVKYCPHINKSLKKHSYNHFLSYQPKPFVLDKLLVDKFYAKYLKQTKAGKFFSFGLKLAVTKRAFNKQPRYEINISLSVSNKKYN